MEWETYRDLFITVVHNAEKTTDVEKFSCLLMGVHGKAREIVSKYKLSETNYKLAWNDLVFHYENKRRLVGTHMSELLQTKPMKGKSASNLEKLKRDIDSPIELLKSLSRPVELWDNFILFLTTSRFADNNFKIVAYIFREFIKTSTHEAKKGVSTHQAQAKILPDNAQSKVNKKKHCSCSSKEHFITSCDQFSPWKYELEAVL